ncbi:hypothetical protein EBZ37_08190 [bacterium]|nr:hypothetical protein [bacterium]
MKLDGSQIEDDSEWVKALRALPEKDVRIFNMEWDVSPLVLYARPDVRVVDLLDPSFLVQHDRPLHEAREAIARGDIVDAQGYLSEAFQADYVLTKNPGLALRFDGDPLLERVFPKQGSKYPGPERLFRLNAKNRQHLLSEFNPPRGARGLRISQFPKLTPESSSFKPFTKSLPEAPVYLDFAKLFDPPQDRQAEPSDDAMKCVSIEPSIKERAKWVGRSILGIGGGRNVRIWLNKKPFYHSITMSNSAQVVHQLIDFGRALRPQDEIQAVVCSRESSPVFGLSLSFFSESELSDLCERKQWKAPETLEDARPWQQLGRTRLSCLADFATAPTGRVGI